MSYPTRISEPTFQFGREFSPGWGELTVGETGISISGKGQAGCASQFFLGWLLSSALASRKTLAIPYSDVVNVSVSGKQLTLEYMDKKKGKPRRIFLRPFVSRGFFGAKDPQAKKIAEIVQEKCAG